MTAYTRIAALAERYSALVLAGAWDEAAAVAAEQERLRAALPGRPPGWAAPELESALLETRRAEAALVAGLDTAGAEIAALADGRRLVAAYHRA